MRTTHLTAALFILIPALVVAATGGTASSAPGTISGVVTYTGKAPPMRPIDMAREPSCAQDHPTPVLNESVMTGPGNTLGHVVVYISAGDKGSTTSATPVRYTQRGCQYLPHIAVLQAGQRIEIYNEDKTSHNIHPVPVINPEWNKAQPPGSPPLHESFGKPEFIHVKCNIHPWMHGYFAVLSTSHHATTGANGRFSLKGLPAGTYTVTAWHERFGTQSQEVTVGSGESPPINFVFAARSY